MDMTKQTLPSSHVSLGCDPELFLVKKGTANRKQPVVVGSERYIKKARGNGLVNDGVQVELHTYPTACRANISNELQNLFRELQTLTEKHGLEACFKQVVTVSAKELAALSTKAQQLGCMPSLNIYGRRQRTVNGMVYRRRSAAGHIHIGTGGLNLEATHLIPLLDLLVAIPSMLIEKDPQARERRRLYGKAGEYRKPTYGFEYRTLSNFWLRNYRLMSFVMGQIRVVAGIAYAASLDPEARAQRSKERHIYDDRSTDWNCFDKFLNIVDPKKVERAINRNDLDLAATIWEKVKPVWNSYKIFDGICTHIADAYTSTTGGIENKTIWLDWDYFVSKPIEFWFPEDPLTHWTTKPEGHGTGWESFFTSVVRQKRLENSVAEARK
jgi:hypothetical protein